MADKMDQEQGHIECHTEEKQVGINSSTAFANDSTTQNGLRTVDAGFDPNDVRTEYTVDPVEARRIMRKIDFRVIPLLSLLYL